MLSKLCFCVRLPLTVGNWIESGHLNKCSRLGCWLSFGFWIISELTIWGWMGWQFVTLQTGIIFTFVPRFMGSNVGFTYLICLEGRRAGASQPDFFSWTKTLSL